jgi:hypothetical protein
MEREHLIIIALILVALYMMNKDTKDTVVSMGPAGPMGRIRYNIDPMGPICGGEGKPECFSMPEPFAMPNRVRYSDKHFASSQHIKNHIRNRNMNSMFSGMMGTEPFRFNTECPEGDPAQCVKGYP